MDRTRRDFEDAAPAPRCCPAPRSRTWDRAVDHHTNPGLGALRVEAMEKPRLPTVDSAGSVAGLPSRCNFLRLPPCRFLRCSRQHHSHSSHGTHQVVDRLDERDTQDNQRAVAIWLDWPMVVAAVAASGGHNLDNLCSAVKDSCHNSCVNLKLDK